MINMTWQEVLKRKLTAKPSSETSLEIGLAVKVLKEVKAVGLIVILAVKIRKQVEKNVVPVVVVVEKSVLNILLVGLHLLLAGKKVKVNRGGKRVNVAKYSKKRPNERYR